MNQFKVDQYITAEQITELTDKIGLNEQQVKVRHK